MCSAAPVLLLAMILPFVGSPVARASPPVSKIGVRTLGRSAEATIGAFGGERQQGVDETIGGEERAEGRGWNA